MRLREGSGGRLSGADDEVGSRGGAVFEAFQLRPKDPLGVFQVPRRPTLNTCLVQPAGVDASFPNESLASVSSAVKRNELFTENWNYSVPSGVRPLDFRDHIPVSRCSVDELEMKLRLLL